MLTGLTYSRTVVEGVWPHKLAPCIRENDDAEESDPEAEEAGIVGTIFRLSKGQLKRLEGGMEQYVEIAARAAAKLGRVKTTT
jgi:ATP-binding cassette subfamily F protein 3